MTRKASEDAEPADEGCGGALPLFIPSPPSLSSIYYLVLSFRFAPVIFQYKIRSMRNPQ